MNNDFPFNDRLDELDFYDPAFKPKNENSEDSERIFQSPRSIYEYLDSVLWGQDELKKGLALFMYKMLHTNSSDHCIMICAESGSGKSASFHALSQAYGKEHCIYCDSAGLTPAGFHGQSLSHHLRKVDPNSDKPYLVFCDEFDKFLTNANGSSWGESSLISELLVVTDGKGMINVGTADKSHWIDCSKLFFIFAGSFSQTTYAANSKSIGFNADLNTNKKAHRSEIKIEDVEKLLTPELKGRISKIIVLENLTPESLYQIARSKLSPIRKLEDELGIKIKVSKSKLLEFSMRAFENETGCRGLRQAVEEIVDQRIWASNDNNISEIYIR